MKNLKPAAVVFFLAIFFSCSTKAPELKLMHEVTGPIETNCYLIYDNQTMEAALVDVGGPIDSLVKYIEQNDLDLKYFLCTHGHPDHLIEVPDLRNRFPETKLVLHNRASQN